MSVLEDLLLEKLFSFLWKVIKFIGSLIRFPFVDRKYNLEQLSNQNSSGVVGIIILTTIVFLLVN